jgi:hypothetical protein
MAVEHHRSLQTTALQQCLQLLPKRRLSPLAVEQVDLGEDRVRTMILLSLAGDVAREAMEGYGVNFSGRLSNRVVRQVPGRALVEVNKRIGLKLLARAGGRGVAQFPKAIPVVGGVVGGAFDAVVCRAVGRTAKALVRPSAGWPAIGSAAPEHLLTNTE